jgi:hypothetical protein
MQGCKWCSFADKEDCLTGEVDKVTFKRFKRIAKEQPDLCEMIPFYAIWNGEKPDGGDPWYKDLVPDVSILIPEIECDLRRLTIS